MQFNMFAELSKQAIQAYDLGQQFLAQDDEDGSDDLDVDDGLGLGWDWKNDTDVADSSAAQAGGDDPAPPEGARRISCGW